MFALAFSFSSLIEIILMGGEFARPRPIQQQPFPAAGRSARKQRRLLRRRPRHTRCWAPSVSS